MTIICTKEEFAEMMGHCVSNELGNNCYACKNCAIYEKCEGAYVDTLTKIIKVEE